MGDGKMSKRREDRKELKFRVLILILELLSFWILGHRTAASHTI